jgi:hypothetical protein
VTKDDATETFVQEVDQSVREEQLLAQAKRYGPWLAGLFILVLAALGGWQWWQQQQQNVARSQAAEYAAAQQLAASGNLDGAKAAFEHLTTQGPETYRVMARMEYAALLSVQGDLDGSIAAFDQAAAAARDPVMKETAQLRAAYIAAETQDFEALQRRLQPLVQSHSRLSYLARELLAIQAWRSGHNDVARSTLEDLTLAFDAPEGVRQRAQVALALVGRAPAPTTSAAAPSANSPASSPANSPARGAATPAPSGGAHP